MGRVSRYCLLGVGLVGCLGRARWLWLSGESLPVLLHLIPIAFLRFLRLRLLLGGECTYQDYHNHDGDGYPGYFQPKRIHNYPTPSNIDNWSSITYNTFYYLAGLFQL